MTDFDQNNPVSADSPTPDSIDVNPAPNLSPETPTEAPASDTADTAPEERILYRWNYAAPTSRPPADTPRKLSIYALVMTAVFLVSFALLIAVLWVGRYDPDMSIRPGVPGNHDDVAIDGVEQAKPVVTVIEVTTPLQIRSGTGIIVRRDGYIATNHHVVEGATSIKVTFYDGTTAIAHVVGSSEADDLAVIRVDRGDLPEARFAAYSNCYVGETVYAIGAPGGPEFGWTTTKGIISYKDREVKIRDDDGSLLRKMRLLQTDAPVNEGNSGGPLINTAGEVVGVVSMKLAQGFEGIGFAIPADGAVDILNAIIAGKDFDSSVSHQRPMLGITCIDVEKGKYYVFAGDRFAVFDEAPAGLTPDEEVIHAVADGVLIREVTEGMGAYGKLKKNDIITAVNDHRTETGEALTDYINQFYVGDTVTLTVERGSKTITVSLTLTAQINEF